MSYRVLRETPDLLTVLQDGRPAFMLTPDGHGIWAAYECRCLAIDGEHLMTHSLLPVDRGLNPDVVLGRLCSGLRAAGHLAQVGTGYIIPAPRDVGNFYLSGTGFLCARQPLVRVLSQEPLPVGANALLRPATEEDCRAAGLLPEESAVFVGP